MAQSVKYLSYKSESLSLESQTHIKIQDGLKVCSTSAGETKTGRILELIGQSV